MTTSLMSRRIEIDMGHRVPDHQSKCYNLHGHRYVIEATCEGEIATSGEQTGMVVDFGFLKQLMVDKIDKQFDHGLCLYKKDIIVDSLMDISGYMDRPMKIILVDFVPTAENLAAHWGKLIKDDIVQLSQGRAKLVSLKVWETPNGTATYVA